MQSAVVSITKKRPLTNMLKNRGTRIEPWGTHFEIFSNLLNLSPTFVLWMKVGSKRLYQSHKPLVYKEGCGLAYQTLLRGPLQLLRLYCICLT